jgi:hypothetical protein
MWIVRILLLIMVMTPIYDVDYSPMLLGVLFLPAIACSVGVAHKVSDHEDEEDADVVGPVFQRAAKEGLWVLALIVLAYAFILRLGLSEGVSLGVVLMVPTAVFALAGCYVGVLFTKEHMSRQVSSFGGAVLTTAYLVAATSGLYYLLDSVYLSMIWPLPLAIFLVALVARVVATFVAGGVKVGRSFYLTLLVVALVVWTLSAMPLMVPRHRSGTLTACKSNLKNLGTAMEMYSVDWSGRYPPTMELLTPNYLKTIPECPAASKVTYYLETGPEGRGNTEKFEDYYFFMCQGENHKSVDVPKDYPQYNGTEGLLSPR